MDIFKFFLNFASFFYFIYKIQINKLLILKNKYIFMIFQNFNLLSILKRKFYYLIFKTKIGFFKKFKIFKINIFNNVFAITLISYNS